MTPKLETWWKLCKNVKCIIKAIKWNKLPYEDLHASLYDQPVSCTLHFSLYMFLSPVAYR